jgi:lipopolysaccharide transport system permease protein
MLGNIWKYRHFILSSIRHDLITRFIRSKLGGLWVIINPLIQVAIYALILSNILATKLPGTRDKYAYAIYLMAGLLAWTLFNDMINRCLNLFIENGNLMKKMRFPRITLPVTVIGTNLTNNLLLLIAMLVIFLLLGHHFTLNMLWLFPFMAILATFSLGVGLVLGILNVFIRDIGQITPICLQVLFWFTPIVYPEKIIPVAYRHWLNYNPLYYFTSAFQHIIAFNKPPPLTAIIVISLSTVLILSLSLFIFRRANEEMVDVL